MFLQAIGKEENCYGHPPFTIVHQVIIFFVEMHAGYYIHRYNANLVAVSSQINQRCVCHWVQRAKTHS